MALATKRGHPILVTEHVTLLTLVPFEVLEVDRLTSVDTTCNSSGVYDCQSFLSFERLSPTRLRYVQTVSTVTRWLCIFSFIVIK